MSVAQDKGQKAPKGEQSSQTSSVGSQPLHENKELSPSSSIRRPTWYNMTLKDA